MPKYEYQGESKFQPKVVEKPAEVIIKVVKIESLIDSHFVYTGRISGKSYEWPKAGSTTEVLEEDVPELLEKRLGGKSCCGNSDNKIFQIVQ